MSSLRNTGRFLQYTNNVQMARKQSAPGNFPQSLSGSETDVSTSNENLSNEERYVIKHTTRVEPQGQENLQDNSNRNSLKESLQGSSNRSSLKESIGGGPNSNRSSLDVSSSSYNTLIIHNAGQDDPWTGRLSGIRDHPSNVSNHSSSQSPSYHSMIGQTECKKSSGIPLAMNTSHKDRNSLPRNSGNFMDVMSNQRVYNSSSEHGVQEITEIPDDYLNQSSVLKHLAKEVAQSPTSRSPSAPPATPPTPSGDRASPAAVSASPRQTATQGAISKGLTGVKARGRLSKDKLSLSYSQPDLSSVGVRPLPGGSESSWLEASELDEIGCYTDMLDMLVQENAQLKNQLDDAWQKIAKSHKLEEEVSKVHRAHEELVGSCERRERLERAARGRLQSDCRRLHDVNIRLRDQIELLSGQVMRPLEPMSTATETLRKELQNREMLIAQLISQNKELACTKERHEIEIAAQRATLQEQRTHIDILDTALTNAQSNVVRLEEECRHAQGYIERVAQLQRALASLQQASDRRELTERKLRSQLEKELQNQRSRDGSLGPGSGGSSGGANEGELRRKLREREERVLALEGECAKWEQRYLEESALRQAAIDAASIPKDAKIAALEKTSQETERLMAEARNEKIRHMDELHDAQKKCADLEGRLKELESKVAERDAMIKVLQKHTQSQAGTISYASDASDSHYNTHTHSHTHSLRNNSSREELGFGASSSAASFSSQDTVPMYHHSVLTHLPSTHSSNSHAGMIPKYGSTANSLNKPSGNAADPTSFEGKKRTLDDQLAKLDSQLLSKRGLCCFPAFSGASTGPRKGKLPKPLAGPSGTGALFEPGFLGNLVVRPPHDQGRPEEIMLLEKQGLSSQQQRMQDAAESEARRSGSLPPSSLPRPPRKPSIRRFGEYGRLSDTEVKKNNVDDNVEMSTVNRNGSSRPLLPPRRLGDYGRLNDDSTSQRSLRKPSVRSGTPSVPGSSSPSTSNSRESLMKGMEMRNNSSLSDTIMKNMSMPGNSSRESLVKGPRDSGGSTTMSDNSASSLPPPSKLQAMYASSRVRRGNSLSRESKSNDRTVNKYRIQF
ncbi:uncharacterized protein LOC143917206 isoform X2 [Arctopsyche grandis]|uniref:uncharacterized protein LOC143917206 isoform X2 n=1 Tax=Arctopsyche grandis TaxID=121162 RepID=UPI00406D72FB